MSALNLIVRARGPVLLCVLATTLSGCTYDYLQHTDRVSYAAGEAGKANLERETTDPARKSKGKTSGLGKNGPVVPTDDVASP